jgi:hypothetical protein
MIARYNQIASHINRQDSDLIPYLLSPTEDAELIKIEITLKKINDVTVLLI